MNKTLANSKCFIVCLLFISIAMYMSAQNKGIPLKSLCINCSRDYSGEKGSPTPVPTPEWQIGQDTVAINTFLEKYSLSLEEYLSLKIATSKHKLLSTIPYQYIAKGPVLAQNKVGKVQVIYGVAEERGSLDVHVYLFSFTNEGKYIDSVYGTLYGEIYVGYNRIQTSSDLGSCATETNLYIVTPQLKFKKIEI